MSVITVRKRSCGKIMFLRLSVSHSVHGREVYTPLGRDSPGGHPLGRPSPLGRHPHPRRPLQRRVRIILECILVYNCIHICHYCKPNMNTNVRNINFTRGFSVNHTHVRRKRRSSQTSYQWMHDFFPWGGGGVKNGTSHGEYHTIHTT